MESKVLTIMFTDMKGFTETSGTRSRQGVLDLVKLHDELLRPVVDHFKGKVIKTIGDAFLVIFESPTNAVLCGLLMQHTLREHNLTATREEQIEIRVSINSGEVQLTENDIFGEPVNIASRINGVTEPNEVYFTEAVYLAMNKQEVPSSKVGEFKLKGIAEPIRCFRVIQEQGHDQYRKVLSQFRGVFVRDTSARPAPAAAPPAPAAAPPKKGKGAWPLIAGTVILIALAAVVATQAPFGPSWTAKVEEFVQADGFDKAWEMIDERFNAEPTDGDIKPTARRLLDKEVPYRVERDGHEKTVERLNEYRDKRPYIPDIDATIIKTRQDWAAALIKDGGFDPYAKGLEILWALYEADKGNARLLLDWVAAYHPFRQSRAYLVMRHLAEVVEMDESLAGDPRVKEIVLDLLKNQKLRSGYEESEKMCEFVAKYYLDDVREWLRPLLTDETDVESRVAAYGVFSRADKLPEGQVFEYHRLNLFQCRSSHRKFHEEAVAYFDKWLDRKAEARRHISEKPYLKVPNLEASSGTKEADATQRIVGELFYLNCRDYLLRAVNEPGNMWLRYRAHQLLEQNKHATSELTHKYHVLNLAEYDDRWVFYKLQLIRDGLDYFLKAEIADPARRKSAVETIDMRLAEIKKVRTRDIKQQWTIEWLDLVIDSLTKARDRLSQ